MSNVLKVPISTQQTHTNTPEALTGPKKRSRISCQIRMFHPEKKLSQNAQNAQNCVFLQNEAKSQKFTQKQIFSYPNLLISRHRSERYGQILTELWHFEVWKLCTKEPPVWAPRTSEALRILTKAWRNSGTRRSYGSILGIIQEDISMNDPESMTPNGPGLAELLHQTWFLGEAPRSSEAPRTSEALRSLTKSWHNSRTRRSYGTILGIIQEDISMNDPESRTPNGPGLAELLHQTWFLGVRGASEAGR